MCGKCLNQIHLPLPSLPTVTLPLTLPVLHCLSVCSMLSGVLPWYFTVNLLYFSQSNPLYFASSSFPYPVLLSSLQCVSLCLVPTHCGASQYCSLPVILLFLSSFLSLLVPFPLLETCSVHV
jgi:hypothetical protein